MAYAAPLLRAEWRHLVILNFEIDPAILRPFVPRGTQLDAWQGRTHVSMVGFLFMNTRVFGVPIPFHRSFEEVNLRFYVRREGYDGRRRGVVFIKEIVPRATIALGARVLYNENYLCLPMRHHLERDEQDGSRIQSVSYHWIFARRECQLRLVTAAAPADIPSGGFGEFITEQSWGYCVQRDGGTVEYRVEHPRWRVAAASEAHLDCDAAGLYGQPFVACLSRPPASAWLADGSEVAVYGGVRLAC